MTSYNYNQITTFLRRSGILLGGWTETLVELGRACRLANSAFGKALSDDYSHSERQALFVMASSDANEVLRLVKAIAANDILIGRTDQIEIGVRVFRDNVLGLVFNAASTALAAGFYDEARAIVLKHFADCDEATYAKYEHLRDGILYALDPDALGPRRHFDPELARLRCLLDQPGDKANIVARTIANGERNGRGYSLSYVSKVWTGRNRCRPIRRAMRQLAAERFARRLQAIQSPALKAVA